VVAGDPFPQNAWRNRPIARKLFPISCVAIMPSSIKAANLCGYLVAEDCLGAHACFRCPIVRVAAKSSFFVLVLVRMDWPSKDAAASPAVSGTHFHKELKCNVESLLINTYL